MAISPNINNTPQQPQIGAYTLNGSNKLEAGNFVVNPYSDIYKFSLYDELHLDKDNYKEMHDIIFKNKLPQSPKKRKAKRIIKNIFKVGIAIGSAVLIYKYRTPIKTKVIDLFNKIKNAFRPNP